MAVHQGLGRTAREIWSGQRRTPDAESQHLAFQIGIVMDDYDDQHAGRVWVYFPNLSSLERGESALPYGPVARGRTVNPDGTVMKDQSSRTAWILCYPMFPFFGSDDFRHGGDTNSERSGRQGQSNSYGWWMGQPRIGDYVGVLFAYGDSNQGYWIGCVPKPNQNFMVPGHAAEANAGADENTTVMEPSMEKSVGERDQPRKVASNFASSLGQAGLLGDSMRGAGTSSSTRESPSYVFGFKSPGWTYEIEKELPIGGGSKSPFKSNSAKYGKVNAMGHQLVFDDHPDSQIVRVRTSNGSQILLNDTDGYVYINTAKGNTWLEMSDNGDVNGFSTGAFSWHAEGDINMTTDANWNVQVKGNWNVAVGENTTWLLNKAVTVFSGQGGQALQWEHKGPHTTIITGATKLQVKSSMETLVQSDYKVTTQANYELISGSTTSIKAGNELNQESGSATNIKAGSSFYVHSGADTSLQAGGTSFLDGAAVLWGVGGPVAKATGIESPEAPQPPGQPELAKTWGPTPAGGGVAEKIPYVGSIVPQHEPWPGHPVKAGRGNITYNSSFVNSIRRGATTASAKKPVDYVDKDGNIRRGKDYATKNPGEAPKYVLDGKIDPSKQGPAANMTLSEEGKKFIKKQEGWSSVPYPDAHGYSVGYGHLIQVGDRIGGRTITEADMALIRQGKGAQVINIDKAEGERLFEADIPKYQSAVQRNITAPITQGQFDAMTSLSYNVGPDWIRKSTMTKKFNEGDIPGAISHFQAFNKSEGQVHPGLVRRRSEEIDQLFSAGIPVRRETASPPPPPPIPGV